MKDCFCHCELHLQSGLEEENDNVHPPPTPPHSLIWRGAYKPENVNNAKIQYQFYTLKLSCSSKEL